MTASPLRVLSLDGGGMRGTYTATYLELVAKSFAQRRGVEDLDIGGAFDLIVGTSTGAIIGCALAAGEPLAKVIDLYRVHGPAIFKRPMPKGFFGFIRDHLSRSTALASGDNALRAALEGVLGNMTIADLYERRGIAIAIPTVEMSQHRAWVFKTPHFAATNRRDDHYKLVDVCMATSAAPAFRSMAAVDHPGTSGGDYNVFVDGGLWANNPVLVGLIEAIELADAAQPIEIFCLGTCPVPAGEQIERNALHRDVVGWTFGAAAASLAVDAQQFAYDHMAKKIAQKLGRDCSIVRFPSEKVPAALIPYLGLDDASDAAAKALINQARTDADMLNSRCAYRATDREADLICGLFESAPIRTTPLFKRNARESGLSQPPLPERNTGNA